MTFADSHCHLDDGQFDADRDAVVQRAIDAGVVRMIAVGTGEGPPDLEAGIRLAERYEPFRATAGIHPEHAARATERDLQHLEAVLRHPKCVAAGEIGLDYYWKPFDKDRQQAVFVEQLAIAAAVRKPVVIHTRDAWHDTIALLRRHWSSTALPCVMHCFGGGPEQALEAVTLGFYVSFAGVITFPKAEAVREAAKIVPLDRLLVETDAPYLAPVPKRGKRNEPAFVVHTTEKMAELRGVPVSEVAAAVAGNLQNLIGYTEVCR